MVWSHMSNLFKGGRQPEIFRAQFVYNRDGMFAFEFAYQLGYFVNRDLLFRDKALLVCFYFEQQRF